MFNPRLPEIVTRFLKLTFLKDIEQYRGDFTGELKFQNAYNRTSE